MPGIIVTKLTKQLHGFFPSVLLLTSLPLILLSRLPYTFSEYIVYLQLMIASFTHIYLFQKLKDNSTYKKVMRYLIFLGVILVFNYILTRNTSVKQLLYGIVILPSVSLLIYYVPLKKILYHLLFIFALSIIIVRWFVMGNDPDEVTINSRNYIVFYLFLYALPYYYRCYQDRQQPTILYPAVCVVMAIWAIGRGGIIMSVILLLGWFYALAKSSKNKIFILFLLLGTLAYFFYSEFNSVFINAYFSRFEEKGFDSEAREIGWMEYLSSLNNPMLFLFGSPVAKLPYISSVLYGSLHNSYLTLHARLGIFCFFYFFVIAKSLLKLYKSNNFFLFFYFGAVLIKGFVDADFPCITVGGDVNMYLLFLIAISITASPKKKHIRSVPVVQSTNNT